MSLAILRLRLLSFEIPTSTDARLPPAESDRPAKAQPAFATLPHDDCLRPAGDVPGFTGRATAIASPSGLPPLLEPSISSFLCLLTPTGSSGVASVTGLKGGQACEEEGQSSAVFVQFVPSSESVRAGVSDACGTLPGHP